jgi:K+-transporting ATPase KdpF subunit
LITPGVARHAQCLHDGRDAREWRRSFSVPGRDAHVDELLCQEAIMEALIAGLVALLLFLYLFVAVIRPEKF